MSKVLVERFQMKKRRKKTSFTFISIMLINILIILVIHSINSECPPHIIIKPCSCIDQASSGGGKSMTCEHSLFDLPAIFIKLSLYNNLISKDNENVTHFQTFLLYNTSIEYLPENVFSNVTFRNLRFRDNLQLTRIDRNAFTYFQDKVEVLETLNTNLSDTETIFLIIKQFQNLRFLNLQNDRLKFIPNYAFNHSHLTHIYFGMEYLNQTQPIESIGAYAFYNLPKIHFIRIFSPDLQKINKYAFAQRYRYDRQADMLEFYLGGKMFNSNSFPLTSLTRFRNRFVFIRFYNTSLTYFDEEIFQPFLESNPSSLLDINNSNHLFQCDCRSAWIQVDYMKNINQLENRVYGYNCWEYDFSSHCTRNQ